MSMSHEAYEAAMREAMFLAWADDGLGPYKDEAGQVEVNGVSVPRLSDFDKAQRIVDAALKVDGPTYTPNFGNPGDGSGGPGMDHGYNAWNALQDLVADGWLVEIGDTR